MRILYCSDNSSEHNFRFLQKISSAGHDVFFCNFSDGELYGTHLPANVRPVKHGIRLPLHDLPDVGACLPEFLSVLERIRPDLVHAGPAQRCGYIAALADFHPLIVMSWGSDLLLDAHRGPEWRHATQISLQGADGFVCDSDAVLSSARQYASLEDTQVAQFPWGITPGVFSPVGLMASRVANAFGPETIRLICTRSWEPIYRIEMLLNAFSRARKQDSRLRLLLLGDGSESGRIRAFIEQKELGAVVLTPGKINHADLPQWFRAATAFVSFAESDGTSISMLEAMATGLPVLLTDIASNREWVRPGENGWLGSEVNDFAEKMLLISRLSSGEREAIAARNCQLVASRANWNTNFPRLLDLYARVACGKIAVTA